MSFLLFLFVIVLVLFLSILSFGISLIRGVLSIFFPSLRRQVSSPFGQTRQANSQSTGYRDADSSKKTKIFDRTEGDYADYEEVK